MDFASGGAHGGQRRGQRCGRGQKLWRMWLDLNKNRRILRLYRDEVGGSKAAEGQGRCGAEEILVIIGVWRLMKGRGKK